MFNRKKYMKEYNKNNPRDRKKCSKQWRKNNPEKVKENNKQYRKNNIEKVKEHMKQWREDNSERIKQYRKDHSEYFNQWRKDNPEYFQQYRRNNNEKRKVYHTQYMKTRRRIDFKFNLNSRMSLLIRQSLKSGKKDKHWESFIDYTLNDLIKWLLKTMPLGYDWNNFLRGELHIDHIIPISVFNFTQPEHIDFKRCWALSNLQLLPAQENLSKGAKLSRPFQPALQI